MLRITEEDYNELMDIMDGYVQKLEELPFGSEEYKNLKWELDDKFCGINMTTEHHIIHAELEIGNVIIKDNVLTCIYDNSIHRYKMLHRKANNGELVYITNATDTCPFNKRYVGRCFRVDKQPDAEMLEWVHDYVGINIEGLDVGWCLYDDQYVVLEEIECIPEE